MAKLTWHQTPRDQGQIVDRTWASDGERVYLRTVDRSDGEVHLYTATWFDLCRDCTHPWHRPGGCADTPGADSCSGCYEPWNGVVPRDEDLDEVDEDEVSDV